ncbi:MAG: hypothetical protein OEO83_02665 [Alphaproteobacteria bacterium]|nr:hypothetical protein [Alphaproteobacteria bacterium]
MRVETFAPVTSWALYPNIVSAAGLKDSIKPLSSMVTMPSEALSVIPLLRTSLSASERSIALRFSASSLSIRLSRAIVR